MSRRAAFLASLALFLGLAAWLTLNRPASALPPLLVYCAAGIRPPVAAAEAAYDGPLQIQYGGSQTLFANLQASGTGDLYLPADDSYLDLLRSKGLLREVLPLAEVRPVLAVRQGNPRGVRDFADLSKEGIRISVPMPGATACGKLLREALRDGGRWASVESRATVTRATVNEVAGDLKLGAVDAGFVWDATVRQHPDLEAVALPELEGLKGSVSAAVLATSRNPAAALRFARFLASPERGQPAFEKEGYTPAGGDPWAPVPTLLVYAGAMLRPAIEATMQAFERREGCEIRRVYNGCGILVGQMKTGARPDLYFSCDASFMDMVKDRFEATADVSINQLVIAFKKGNPHGIASLKDLGKPGLRVGVGHEQQCALGALTSETLRQSRTLADVMRNVVVQAPAGDLLVNQLRAGGLDAAVVYVSNLASSSHELDAAAVNLPCAMAVQPVGVAKGSARPRMARRLMEVLLTPESRARFEAEGFRWKNP